MLLEYFVKRYASRAGKNIRSIDKKTLELFQSYHWPGNIRELQNVVERSVIVSSTAVLSVDESWFSTESPQPASREQATQVAEAERDHILKALEESKWVVGGKAGAAARLGLHRTTLISKMKKCGISRGWSAPLLARTQGMRINDRRVGRDRVEWVRSGKLAIKFYPSASLHAKLYIIDVGFELVMAGRFVSWPPPSHAGAPTRAALG
jgi:hypothetical protein